MPMTDDRVLMFIDESGTANLNFKSDLFVLSTVLINKKDYHIIEGMLGLVKRRHFHNDFKNLHANELFESPKTSYPELKTDKQLNSFLGDLCHVLQYAPYLVRSYAVDKTRLYKVLNYTPAPKRKPKGINLDMPYELSSVQAIEDFTRYLIKELAQGEIIIESRLFSDTKFVSYFDSTRQYLKKGSVQAKLAKDTNQRVTSLVISNKQQKSAGLELADLVAYVVYRQKTGDPGRKVVLPPRHLATLHGIIKKHTYANDKGVKSLVYNV